MWRGWQAGKSDQICSAPDAGRRIDTVGGDSRIAAVKFIADLHIHSRYSRATSQEMDIPAIAASAQRKGIKLVGTGDFTHPAYRESLRKNLKPLGNGLYAHGVTNFILSAELNSIYTDKGRLRRIHNLVFVPSLEAADRISQFCDRYGKLEADGRPTLSVSSRELLQAVLDIDASAFVVPAHIWTPWFSLFGSNSGFDAIEECFGELTREVFALETGLSSDPPMNWRLSTLDRLTLISNSDAHSPNRLGREANVLNCDLDYATIRDVLKTKDPKRFLYTIEFFPEEGKYHYDGHRSCGVSVTPEESTLSGDCCPACGRKLTIGVLHRVGQLADRKPDQVPEGMIPYRHVVPLEEIIAEALGVGRDTAGVAQKYDEMLKGLGTEFHILLDAAIADIVPFGERIAQGIERMRQGLVEVKPGYDGVFGTVKVLPDSPRPSTLRSEPDASGQLGLFG